ncbi:MAG TPA: sigma-54-dependent Fis family transcriptional regulator [Lentisphaeria bacterium]|nr:MAG: Fis family transcriptional regulator [Lentisphaerae bacterium GWF2_38_69]HBM15990.1 sigma-54-dependent Fis family transcriptional regulator [Lentisphaeria bacterium]
MKIRLLLAVKDRKLEKYLEDYFSMPDIEVKCLGQLKSAWQKLVRSCGDIIVISEEHIPISLEANIALLNSLPETPTTILLHNRDSSEENAKLLASGADTVLFVGIQDVSIAEAIYASIESRRKFYSQNRISDYKLKTSPKLTDFNSLNQKMRMFMDEVQQIIPNDTPLLILGETGVGKEHLAKIIHAESPRSRGPFIPVNIAGLPEQLLESELFGHEQGAFTGAIRSRRGAFELAHNGTIFLDEIGEMPLHLQAKLLRVLQDYELKPVGGEKSIWVNVRVIAATNRIVEEEVNKGTFRKDLFYRLNVVTLTVPPLRERPEDIPQIAKNFVELYRKKYSKRSVSISDNAMKALSSYDWPGNVRELMNVIERLVILSKGQTITLDQLPRNFSDNQSMLSNALHAKTAPSSWDNKTMPEVITEAISEIEKLYIQSVLTKTKGRVGEAAKIAGVHPRGFYGKMKDYSISKENFK